MARTRPGAGSPRAVAHPGFPQILACAVLRSAGAAYATPEACNALGSLSPVIIMEASFISPWPSVRFILAASPGSVAYSAEVSDARR